jgi:hypothetical protein
MSNTIKSFNLVITWSDNIKENIAPDLPEYLKEEIDLNEALTHFSIIFTKG